MRGGAMNFRMSLVLCGLACLSVAPAAAQVSPSAGQLMLVSFPYCPMDYYEADGRELVIRDNLALYNAIGTTYGGDNRVFQLPDLRSRAAVGNGVGPGLLPVAPGQKLGHESLKLAETNLPPHAHRGGIQTSTGAANRTTANGNAIGISASDSFIEGYDPPAGFEMEASMVVVAPEGQSAPIATREPFVALRWCIAYRGGPPAPTQ